MLTATHLSTLGLPHRPMATAAEAGDPTWPRSRVTLTSLYSSPRDSGGLCHQRSVPSMALLTGCALLLLAAVQMSQYWPCGGGRGQMAERGWHPALPVTLPPSTSRTCRPPPSVPVCSASTYSCLLCSGFGGTAPERDSHTLTEETEDWGKRRVCSFRVEESLWASLRKWRLRPTLQAQGVLQMEGLPMRGLGPGGSREQGPQRPMELEPTGERELV